MKKIFVIIQLMLFIIASTTIIYAQVPQGIPYQAVARDGAGQPLDNQAVKVRFSILDSILAGPVVYAETHTVTTSPLGLFTANVGMGTVVNGSFSNINWAQNFKFLKVELDTTGVGNNYINLGTQQMMSVPYALYAQKSLIDNTADGDTSYWKANGNSIFYNNGNVGIGTSSPVNSFELINPTTAFQFLNTGGVYFRRNAGNVIFMQTTDNQLNSDLSAIKFMRGDGSGTPAYLSTISDGTNGVKALGLSFNLNNSLFLKSNGAINVKPQNIAPSSPSKGDIYFDNNINKLRVWDGTTWQNCW